MNNQYRFLDVPSYTAVTRPLRGPPVPLRVAPGGWSAQRSRAVLPCSGRHRPASRPFSAPPVACHARTLPAAAPPFYVCASIGRDRVRPARIPARRRFDVARHRGARRRDRAPRSAPPARRHRHQPRPGSSTWPSMPLHGPPAAVPGPRTLARRRSRAPGRPIRPSNGIRQAVSRGWHRLHDPLSAPSGLSAPSIRPSGGDCDARSAPVRPIMASRAACKRPRPACRQPVSRSSARPAHSAQGPPATPPAPPLSSRPPAAQGEPYGGAPVCAEFQQGEGWYLRKRERSAAITLSM